MEIESNFYLQTMFQSFYFLQLKFDGMPGAHATKMDNDVNSATRCFCHQSVTQNNIKFRVSYQYIRIFIAQY